MRKKNVPCDSAVLNGQLKNEDEAGGAKSRLDGGQIEFLMHHAVFEGTQAKSGLVGIGDA